jgi:hypothetical protein
MRRFRLRSADSRPMLSGSSCRLLQNRSRLLSPDRLPRLAGSCCRLRQLPRSRLRSAGAVWKARRAAVHRQAAGEAAEVHQVQAKLALLALLALLAPACARDLELAEVGR